MGEGHHISLVVTWALSSHIWRCDIVALLPVNKPLGFMRAVVNSGITDPVWTIKEMLSRM